MRFLTKLPSRPAPRRELFRRSPGSMGDSIGRPATPFAVYSAVKRANLRLPPRRNKELFVTRRGARLLVTLAVCASASQPQAQSSFKTVGDMARECITDNLFLTGSCSGYILGSIDALENDRRARGEDPCLAGHGSKDDVVKEFIRAILANYADKGDLPASMLIEDVYRKKCTLPK